jgi:hypothetical protein
MLFRVATFGCALSLALVAVTACAPEPGEWDDGDETGETEGGDGDGDNDPSAALYDPEHLVEVEIELAEADWDELRFQTRDVEDILFGEGCLDEPFGSPFTYFPATATVDGITLEQVGVRKKGFLGSLHEEKPGLKLEFDEYTPNQTAHGVKRMTLNNSAQDPAFVRQCLVYKLFNDAGIVASRCNFAHVVVNDRDLGVFINVEPVKKPFLARHFESDAGNLYEGTLSDFRVGWDATFEKKTNEIDPDYSDIQRVVEALEASDANVEDRVGEEVDFDEFLDFWATETLVAHWDGYAGNANNFFVYRDPGQARFVFMPWGVDGTLGVEEAWGPHSVLAQGLMANRFYEIPSTRDRYRERLQVIMDDIWDEESLVAEIDRMEDLISPVADDFFVDDLPGAIEDVRAFVENRRAQIQPELDESPPVLEEPLRDSICFVANGDVNVSFSTTWNTLDSPDPFNTGTATVDATIDGQTLDILEIGAQAGMEVDEESGEDVAQIVVLAHLSDGNIAAFFVGMAPDAFNTGTQELGWTEAFGAVIHFDPNGGEEDWEILGTIFGELTLDEASMVEGGAVSGSFAGELFE